MKVHYFNEGEDIPYLPPHLQNGRDIFPKLAAWFEWYHGHEGSAITYDQYVGQVFHHEKNAHWSEVHWFLAQVQHQKRWTREREEALRKLWQENATSCIIFVT